MTEQSYADELLEAANLAAWTGDNDLAAELMATLDAELERQADED